MVRPCIHWRGQSKIWLIKSKANGDHKVGHLFIIFLHFYSFNIVQRHFIFLIILLLCSVLKKLFFMLIWKSCRIKNTFELFFLTFLVVFCQVYFSFLTETCWRQYFHIQVAFQSSLCGMCRLHFDADWKSADSRACIASSRTPSPLPLPSFMSTTFLLSSKLS